MSLATDLIDYVIATNQETASLKTQLADALSKDAADLETIKAAQKSADDANAALTALQADTTAKLVAAQAATNATTKALADEAALQAAITPTPVVTPAPVVSTPVVL